MFKTDQNSVTESLWRQNWFPNSLHLNLMYVQGVNRFMTPLHHQRGQNQFYQQTGIQLTKETWLKAEVPFCWGAWAESTISLRSLPHSRTFYIPSRTLEHSQFSQFSTTHWGILFSLSHTGAFSLLFHTPGHSPFPSILGHSPFLSHTGKFPIPPPHTWAFSIPYHTY